MPFSIFNSVALIVYSDLQSMQIIEKRLQASYLHLTKWWSLHKRNDAKGMNIGAWDWPYTYVYLGF